jgi:hypothetical protein
VEVIPLCYAIPLILTLAVLCLMGATLEPTMQDTIDSSNVLTLNVSPRSLSFKVDTDKYDRIKQKYSYDAETARIMQKFAVDEDHSQMILDLVEKLIGIDPVKAEKILIQMKATYTYEDGKKIGQ